MRTLVIIDTHALVHRSWHALPPLTSPDGRAVNAVYGFISVFLKMLRELKPDYIVAAYDLAGPTFREKAFREYKATRAATPSELEAQFPIIREFLQTIGVPVLEAPGFEADDVIGTVVEQARVGDNDLKIIILTGDLDTLQLVDDERVVVYTLRRGLTDTIIYDEKAVAGRYIGLKPGQLADLRGLKGDPSDNIPGVKGIGEKTAIALLKEFGTLDGILRAVDNPEFLVAKKTILTPKAAERLKSERDNALISRMLAIIRRDAPITFVLDNAVFETASLFKARKFFEELGFKSFLNRMPARAEAGTDNSIHEGFVTEGFSIEDFDLAKIKGLERFSVFWSGEEIFIGGPQNTVFRLRLDEASKLEALFESKEKFVIIGFDLKPLLKLVKIFKPKVKLFDCQIAWWLLHPAVSSPQPEATVSEEFNIQFSELTKPVFTALLLEFHKRLTARLEALGLIKLYQKIESPLIALLAQMEERGVLVDKKAVITLAAGLESKIRELEVKIWEMAGEKFRIASPVELRRILFEKLKLQSGLRLRKTPGGIVSTQERELAKLESKHQIIGLLRRWREYSKLQNTYLKTLIDFINPATSRIHATFIQTGTVTGRLACANPNLQNIPAGGELGQEIRNFFIAPEGFSLVSFDYSQLELRIAAHLSQDKTLQKVFFEGGDVHRETAAAIFGVKSEEVSAELRSRAKTLNFAMLYGMGPASVAESTGMSREEARAFIDAYFAKFSGLRRYFTELIEQANSRGYIETMFGRKRFMPSSRSAGWVERGRIERMLANFPIQGTEADIVKLAMLEVQKEIQGLGLEQDIFMLLQIHDELLFEIRDVKLKQAIAAIRSLCERVVDLSVPLKVEVKAGKRWGDLRPV